MRDHENLHQVEVQSLLDAVHLSYRSQGSDALWLRSIIEQIAPSLDVGCGVFGWLYDARNLDDVRIYHPTLLGAPPGSLEAVFASLGSARSVPGLLEEHYSTPAGSVSSQLREAYDGYSPLHDHLAPLGIRDIVTINSFDVDGWGLAINAFRPQPVTLVEQERETFERVAAHLIAAYRLRRASRVEEAVFTPNGVVQHATGEAKAKEKLKALTSAARALEATRGALRDSAPGELLQTWRALVDGRWSIVHLTDTDGKRLIVARVNEPESVVPQTKLSRREHQVVALVGRGHSNKLIAYDLGVSEGTVTSHLRSSMGKLGVTTRAEVISLFAARAGRA